MRFGGMRLSGFSGVCAGQGLTTPVLEQLRVAVRDGCRAQEEVLMTAGSPSAARCCPGSSPRAACCAGGAPAQQAMWSDVLQVRTSPCCLPHVDQFEEAPSCQGMPCSKQEPGWAHR